MPLPFCWKGQLTEMEDKKDSNTDFQSIRSEYLTGHLEASDLKPNPFDLIQEWLSFAISAKVSEPNAMTLASCGKDGQPSARIVLLKGISEEGFLFFTNYESRKGTQLSENPRAALLFFWPSLERQVRIEGRVSRTSRKESRDYFISRPEESRLGAWVSRQSKPLNSREFLLNEFQNLQLRPGGKLMNPPAFWGGYILKPERFEFWQGRENRLHDRFQYQKKKNGWEIQRLFP